MLNVLLHAPKNNNNNNNNKNNKENLLSMTNYFIFYSYQQLSNGMRRL